MGRRATRIMIFEVKMAFPILAPVFLMMDSFAILLNFSIPTSCALWASTTIKPSTTTTVPSMIIPKSTAPSDSRFTLIPSSLRQVKANNKDSGIIKATMSDARQSAKKISTMSVTKIIPSMRLWVTVSIQKSSSVWRL